MISSALSTFTWLGSMGIGSVPLCANEWIPRRTICTPQEDTRIATPQMIHFQRPVLSEIQDDAGHEHVRQREREDRLPPEPHQLVVPEPRKGPAHPDEEPQEEEHLGGECAQLEQDRGYFADRRLELG